MTNIVVWIIFGALTGWIASLMMQTSERRLYPGDIVVGIIGAILGGLLATALGGSWTAGYNPTSMFVIIGGSMLIIAVMRIVNRV